MLDDAGYLFVSGRASDMINRGGQKISPMEVEAAFRTHPGIVDVAVFALAHPVNGQEVTAAVVARRGYRLNERQLRRFARTLLPDWKVPSVIVLLPELPRTSSGKVPRSQLAARLGVSNRDLPAAGAADDPPISPVEQAIAALFIRHLNVPKVGRLEDFFEMGGDSFRAFQVVQGIQHSLGPALPVSAVYRWPTVPGRSSLTPSDRAWKRSRLTASANSWRCAPRGRMRCGGTHLRRWWPSRRRCNFAPQARPCRWWC